MEATDSGTETGNKALVSRFPSIRIWPSIARPREGASLSMRFNPGCKCYLRAGYDQAGTRQIRKRGRGQRVTSV